MGRDRKNERRGEHFTKLTRSMLETEAWRSLSLAAQALYPWLKLEWKGPTYNNNGRICLSVRQAAEKMGVTPDTARRAFDDLQAKGFIVQTLAPCLGIKGKAKSREFELTEIPLPGAESNQGRKLYQTWRPGCDFEVHRTLANNPTGRNGK
jgi:hypothetical protein